MSLARNTIVQATLTLGSRILGFARDLALAGRFGQGPLMDAFATDVRPMLGELRADTGLDPDPVAAYRRSGYQERIVAERVGGTQAGWGA